MGHGGVRDGAGRKAGGSDKRTADLKIRLTELGYDAIAKIVESANDTANPQHVSARKAIFESVVPKLKAVEMSIDLESRATPPTELARALIDSGTTTT